MIMTKQEALEVVKQDGMQLRTVSDELRDHRDVVLAAISDNPHALQFASEILQNDIGISSLVIKNDAYYFNVVDDRSGSRFSIPMLDSGAPGYFYKYVNYMQLRERSPETFEKVLNWD